MHTEFLLEYLRKRAILTIICHTTLNRLEVYLRSSEMRNKINEIKPK
jgi:hypothetical protein